jgi:hypothetical protein
LICGQGAELDAHTGSLKDGSALFRVWNRTVAAEQRRHVNGESGVPNPASEPRDMGADTRHLGHHDHRRSRAGDMHRLGNAVERNVAALEILKRIRPASWTVSASA